MIEIKRCTEVEPSLVYRTFSEGFSDYIIPLTIEEPVFFQHFFGPEGNALEHSFIALFREVDGKATGVGLILGGLRDFDGLRTLRCGTMCIVPAHRGTGLSQMLWEAHKELAVTLNCQRLFLEVIAGNDRAIAFYQKAGYVKSHDLWYYGLNDVTALRNRSLPVTHQIQPIDIDQIKALRTTWSNVHINWQNEIDAIAQMPVLHYGCFDKGDLVGGLSIRNGSIHLLGVHESHRGQNMAAALLIEALKAHPDWQKLRASFPDNPALKGFYEHLGFKLDPLYQHEMVFPL